jgi:two-component sensor histidine kinase
VGFEARAQREGDSVNLAKLAGRIESLQLLYRDLAADGLGQSVDLGHYLSQIGSAVMHTYAVDGIRLDLKVDHAPVSVNVAMPAGLIVNELLTNAFKYAYNGRGTGTITLRCLREAEINYPIVVADDGVGLPEERHCQCLASLARSLCRRGVKTRRMPASRLTPLRTMERA